MSKRASKIEKHGLGARIQELLASGITTAAKIAEILRKEDNISISDASVCRYLEDARKAIESKEPVKILPKHADKIASSLKASYKKSIIDQHNLGEKVQRLLASGVTVATKIAKILREEDGIKISDNSVRRYINNIKDTVQPDAFKTIRDHVDKVVPEDLKALEQMEALCLKWADEEAKDQLDRVADAAVAIQGEIDTWINLLLNTEDKKALVKKLIRKSLSYLQRDARLQTKRIQAMTMATKIIDLKLRQAGLLDDEGKGRIVILNKREDSKDQDAGTNDGYRPFVISGGKDE